MTKLLKLRLIIGKSKLDLSASPVRAVVVPGHAKLAGMLLEQQENQQRWEQEQRTLPRRSSRFSHFYLGSALLLREQFHGLGDTRSCCLTVPGLWNGEGALQNLEQPSLQHNSHCPSHLSSAEKQKP